MKLLRVIYGIIALLVLVAGQHFFGQITSNSLDFGKSYSAVRDPRQNRGPVLFPPPPPDAVDESSGVIVGASGYGFVPPQQNAHLG